MGTMKFTIGDLKEEVIRLIKVNEGRATATVRKIDEAFNQGQVSGLRTALETIDTHERNQIENGPVEMRSADEIIAEVAETKAK